jgi:hypothetical protein
VRIEVKLLTYNCLSDINIRDMRLIPCLCLPPFKLASLSAGFQIPSRIFNKFSTNIFVPIHFRTILYSQPVSSSAWSSLQIFIYSGRTSVSRARSELLQSRSTPSPTKIITTNDAPLPRISSPTLRHCLLAPRDLLISPSQIVPLRPAGPGVCNSGWEWVCGTAEQV